MTREFTLRYGLHQITRGDDFFFYWKVRSLNFDEHNPEYEGVLASNYEGRVHNGDIRVLMSVSNASETELIFRIAGDVTETFYVGYHLFTIFNKLSHRIILRDYIIVKSK